MPEVIFAILAALAVYGLVKLFLIYVNQKHNRVRDIVYFPGDTPRFLTNTDAAQLQYGRKHMDWNGCEVIAVYNARVLLGQKASMAQLARQFQNAGAMWGWGYFGSDPHLIGRVLARNSMAYTDLHSMAQLTENGIYILSYWTGKPWRSHLHTITVLRDDRGFTGYNVRGEADHRPPETYIQNGFFRGYFIKTQ